MASLPKASSVVPTGDDVDRRLVGDAVAAVEQIAVHEGMESAWTSALDALKEPSNSDVVRRILERYGWTGTQFSTPPDRTKLLQDFLQVYEDQRPFAPAPPLHAASSSDAAQRLVVGATQPVDVGARNAVKSSIAWRFSRSPA